MVSSLWLDGLVAVHMGQTLVLECFNGPEVQVFDEVSQDQIWLLQNICGMMVE